MLRHLRYALQAVEDLAAMRRWHTQAGSGAAARGRVQTIATTIKQLRMAPCRFRRGDVTGTRQIAVHGYVVIYEVDLDTDDNRTAGDVVVLRVFGPGQQRDR